MLGLTEANSRSSSWRSNMLISSSFKVRRASTPPSFVSIKEIVLLTILFMLVIHAGLPHPKSVSYNGNLHQLEHLYTTNSFLFRKISALSFRASIRAAKPPSPLNLFALLLRKSILVSLIFCTKWCSSISLSSSTINAKGHTKFPNTVSGRGGSILPRRFTAWNKAVGLKDPFFDLTTAAAHFQSFASTTSTREGYCSPPFTLITCSLSSATLEALITNLFAMNLSPAIFTDPDMPGISLGGKREDPVKSGRIGSAEPRHVLVQLFNRVSSAAISAILCVRETLIVVPPQLNLVNLTSHMEPLHNSMVSGSAVGRNWSSVS